MTEPLVSIIIPTYDRFDSLMKAIESIENQTYKNFEMIIIDDASKDNRYKNLEDNKNLNVIHLKKNSVEAKGYFSDSVRNHGIKDASGKYIAFLDDDDYWNKNYLKEFQRINYKKNYDLILANTFFVKKNKKREIFHIDINDFTVEKIGLYNPGIRSSATIIRRKSFLDINGYDLKLYYGSADKDFLSRFIKKKKKIKILKKVLVNYRIHESSHSRNTHLMLMSTIKYFSKYFFEISFFYKLRYLKKIFYYLILNLITLFNFSKI